MGIINLSKQPGYIPTLAKWHHSEWSYLNPQENVQKRIDKMQTFLCSKLIPSAFIYKFSNELAGSAAIVENDMDTRMDLSPWLAGVYVAPVFRNKGIGSDLVRHVMGKAQNAGVESLYLFTPDKENFYQRLGWSLLAKDVYHKYPVTVMEVTFKRI